MENKRKSENKKRYSQISLKKRQQLVHSVIQLGQSLTRVAKKLKIKLSTAKLILKKFKKTGVLFNKRLRNAKKQPRPQNVNLAVEEARVSEQEGSPIIEEKQKEKSPQIMQTIENVYQVAGVNMEQFMWLSTLMQQQMVMSWPGYYFVI